jgi:hypothetical protein
MQEQYRNYITAKREIEKAHPGMAEMVYKTEGGSNVNDGFFVYSPESNQIAIHPKRCLASSANIAVEDVPALIKALREFFE